MQKTTRHHTDQNLWDRIWKDKHGHVVIWQMPNAWLITWAALTTVSLFFSGRVADVFSWAGDIALMGWALLEIFKGTNYFRRALGALILYFSIATIIKNF